MRLPPLSTALSSLSILFAASVAVATVTIEWVEVGDPGNAGEIAGVTAGGFGADRICGAVDHAYRMDRFEVTNGQYIEFLNAVAVIDDPHQLFEAEDPGGFGGMDGPYGGIQRLGSPPAYLYRAKNGDPLWLTKPVHFIGCYDALRFANWLHNSQPVGRQDASTTEDGAYDMSLGAGVVRKPGARVFLPNEDEWYKAAYYKGGGTNAGYWNYPTRSDLPPVGELPPGRAAPPGSANYEYNGYEVVGPPYYAVDVGAYTLSAGPYGTHNQAGNVHEWIEDAVDGGRGLHGGGWPSSDPGFAANRAFGYPPEGTIYLHTGFRLASRSDDVGIESPGESPAPRAAWVGSSVEISWTRAPSASGAATFAVFRLDAGRGVRIRIAAPDIVASADRYLFRDRTAEAATTYTYEVLAAEDGVAAPLFQVTITTPTLAFTLHRNQPNPFNPRTTIAYSLPQATHVTLGLYDQRGRLVCTLVDAAVPAGEQAVEWDGRDARGLPAPSGTFVVRLVTEQGVRTGKVTLTK